MSEDPPAPATVPPGIDRAHFEAALADFIDENQLACAGILGVCRLEFTCEVPTLAVTMHEDPPRLLVNPGFLASRVLDEDDARAVLLHEFLHVLLGHTRLFERVDPLTNLALDAVINHIVQRELGPPAGAVFRRLYRPAGPADPLWLLRPHAPGDILPDDRQARRLYQGGGIPGGGARQAGLHGAGRVHLLRLGLLDGSVLADDVLDLLEAAGIRCPDGVVFLGNHDDPRKAHPANRARIDRLLREFNGSGVFRRPQDHGAGAARADAEWAAVDPCRGWRAAAMAALRKVLVDDPRGRPVGESERDYLLPVATAGDRRAVLRGTWNPLLPDFSWLDRRPAGRGLANVYLDVSGSMELELQQLVGLLWRLRDWIRRPFHAFSNGVVPARIENGKLLTRTTGGTQFNDVLEHVVRHRPGRSLVVTDGFIEPIDRRLLDRLRANRDELHVLVAAFGTAEPFERAGIPATRLPPLPTPTPTRP